MNKIVNGVANDYEFPFLENTTENYYQVMNRYYTEEFVKQLQQELQRKDNIINGIKKALKDHKEIKNKTNTKEYYIEVDEVLDYIKELESK